MCGFLNETVDLVHGQREDGVDVCISCLGGVGLVDFAKVVPVGCEGGRWVAPCFFLLAAEIYEESVLALVCKRLNRFAAGNFVVLAPSSLNGWCLLFC